MTEQRSSGEDKAPFNPFFPDPEVLRLFGLAVLRTEAGLLRGLLAAVESQVTRLETPSEVISEKITVE